MTGTAGPLSLAAGSLSSLERKNSRLHSLESTPKARSCFTAYHTLYEYRRSESTCSSRNEMRNGSEVCSGLSVVVTHAIDVL